MTGEITVNGFKQDLRTFKRVSGYCEQFDIHSPQSTVAESLWFSARLRLSPDVPGSTRKAFMQEVLPVFPLLWVCLQSCNICHIIKMARVRSISKSCA